MTDSLIFITLGQGSSLPHKRRRTSKTSQQPEPEVVAVDDVDSSADLTLLLKPRPQGGIVGRVQPLLVPELIARYGLRWHNAEFATEATSLARSVIVRNNIGNFANIYDKLRQNRPKSELHLLSGLRRSHAHAVKNHHGKLADIAASLLFETTTDPRINWVKKEVFGIDDGMPVLDVSHPVMVKLAEAGNGMFFFAFI